MRFAVLGPLAVLQDDHEPTTVRGAKERLLLAVLTAAAPGTVSTDRLLESLWDGEPPVTGRKSLQAHVVRLRSALEPDRPKGSSGRYTSCGADPGTRWRWSGRPSTRWSWRT